MARLGRETVRDDVRHIPLSQSSNRERQLLYQDDFVPVPFPDLENVLVPFLAVVVRSSGSGMPMVIEREMQGDSGGDDHGREPDQHGQDDELWAETIHDGEFSQTDLPPVKPRSRGATCHRPVSDAAQRLTPGLRSFVL